MVLWVVDNITIFSSSWSGVHPAVLVPNQGIIKKKTNIPGALNLVFKSNYSLKVKLHNVLIISFVVQTLWEDNFELALNSFKECNSVRIPQFSTSQ